MRERQNPPFGLLVLLSLAAVIWVSCSPEKKILKAFDNGQYQRVIDYYRTQLDKNPNNGKANFLIAESYRLSNRIREAEPFYRKASGKDIHPDTVKYFLAQSLRASGKYTDAITLLDQVAQASAGPALKDLARRQADGIRSLEAVSKKTSLYRVKNLEALNTPFAEYSPVYLNGNIYFTSSRSNKAIYDASGTPYTDLYKAEAKGAIITEGTVAPLGDGINADLRNEGCVTFTPDGKTMVFARGNSKDKKDGGIDVDLYVSRFRNGTWMAPTPININTQFKEENSEEAMEFSWDSTPCFSPDGRTLYFSSNRKGGFGGNDLYSAQIDSRGRFGRVRNLGPDINTPGNEMFPYVAENGKLYFASDGHPGFGMLDLFVINRVDGKNVAENLGQPMNSVADDFGIFLFQADRGFLSSNREGGKGDDDIYTFRNDDPKLKVVNYALRGTVYSYKKDSTLEALPGSVVVQLDAKNDVMQDFETGADGKFNFRVYENEGYTLMAEADGFLTKRVKWSMAGRAADLDKLTEMVTNITFDTLVILDRKQKEVSFRLENIYFGYDSANIRPASAVELNKLVQILEDNPDIKIEMSAHTDSIGSSDRNMNLSQRRAQATVNYLIGKGIATERLVAKGYGETRPIARNTNPDGTDNPAGRQRNRRTEFRILEIGTGTKKSDGENDDDDKFFRKNN